MAIAHVKLLDVTTAIGVTTIRATSLNLISDNVAITQG